VAQASSAAWFDVTWQPDRGLTIPATALAQRHGSMNSGRLLLLMLASACALGFTTTLPCSPIMYSVRCKLVVAHGTATAPPPGAAAETLSRAARELRGDVVRELEVPPKTRGKGRGEALRRRSYDAMSTSSRTASRPYVPSRWPRYVDGRNISSVALGGRGCGGRPA